MAKAVKIRPNLNDPESIWGSYCSLFKFNAVSMNFHLNMT